MLNMALCASPVVYQASVEGGVPPSPRFAHAVAPVGDGGGGLASFYVFGGEDDASVLNDTFRFVVTSETTGDWQDVGMVDLLRPPGRSHHLAFWDSGRSRVIIIGGNGAARGRTARNDVWELRIRP